ncbi:M23 family metallopeptidase [Microbacterium esteraromaticum]|uniref:M23 family metallopeptidase n=1 Tax=Microbacterium esteraromaticum TaxID=57043 RepID=UPI001A8DF9C2|nr:M23 family metallopeptidase [Microbacterium esteraromaticum]MBN8424393.1 M23 family metallopeptidase [Microbacterium esteraromaticum]
MGAPVLAVSALVTSRTGRRIVVAFLSVVVLLALVALTPLIAIPLALSGSSLAAAQSPPRGPSPVASGDWAYPLAGDYFKGRGFGHNPVNGCSYCSTDHKGYDMAQGCGSTVYAAGGGVVIVAGAHHGWGNTVRIDHGDGVETLYGHMQWGSIRVAVGEQVDPGAPLGAEGNTGQSFGCHLHYEVRRDGRAIDPQPFMATLGLPLK